MGQLGHPDWDKQVIVRFIIAAASSPAPATRCESLHGLCSGAAIGLRERLQDIGDADSQRALGAEHLAPACTTHFSVVDRSTFCSKYVPQQSGVP